eukprot:scaffold16485_cov140-Isochrysis_galbana.AAC.3
MACGCARWQERQDGTCGERASLKFVDREHPKLIPAPLLKLALLPRGERIPNHLEEAPAENGADADGDDERGVLEAEQEYSFQRKACGQERGDDGNLDAEWSVRFETLAPIAKPLAIRVHQRANRLLQ